MKYDGALTVFSPDGHLFQVEYAQEAVKKGTTAVAVRGKTCVVLGVEKKSVGKLQDNRSQQKMAALSDHVAVAFSGLTADARSLLQRMRYKLADHEIIYDESPTIEQVAKLVASEKQACTQSGGRRPYGISFLIAGFNIDGTPKLYTTDPSGSHYEWMANSIGKSSKTVREYLEKNYADETIDSDEKTIELTVKSLMDVVQNGAKSMDIGVITYVKPEKPTDNYTKWTLMSEEEIDKYVKKIEQEMKEATEETPKK